MPRFRKKPVEIEAMELTRESFMAVNEWAAGKPFYISDGARGGMTIFTLEGRMKANFGDWIICGINGEFYPCKPDIFAATYEPVEEDRRLPFADAGDPTRGKIDEGEWMG